MFLDDEDKIRDMENLTKDDFLKSYSYITEKEYDMTFAEHFKSLARIIAKDRYDDLDPESVGFIIQNTKEPREIMISMADYNNDRYYRIYPFYPAKDESYPEWDFSFGEDLYDFLADGYELRFAEVGVHAAIWEDIANGYDEEDVKENKKIKYQVNEIVFAMRNLKYLNVKIVPKEPEPIIKNKFVEPLFLTFLKKKKVDIDENFGTRKTKPETSKTEFIENNFHININIEKNTKKNKKRIKNKKLNEIKELDEKEHTHEYKNKNQTVEEKIENKKRKHKMKNIFNDEDSLNAPPSKNKIKAKPEMNKSIKDIKTTQVKETSDNNDKIFNNDIINLNLDTEGDKAPTKTFTEKQKQKIKDILKYNNDELNDLTYKEAIKYDHRTFFQVYFALLKSKHNLITIIESKDYNARVIKVFLLFFSFAFNYAVNALFFDDDTMHKIHEDGGNFNFWYQLPQIAYSTIISYILENFLNFLALSEDEVLNVKREKIVKNVGRKGKETLRRLSLKFLLFYVISLFLLILFWYYVSCFCAVYKNTQYHLIKDTLVSFGTGFLYPFGMYLIPPIFRIPALKSYSKTKAAMYKFSQLLLFF